MAGKFLRNLGASSLQLILNQGLGLAAFYILAINLSKNDFGQLNWALAVFLTAFGILTLGLDQVVVKKIASGENASKLISIYTGHVLVSGSGFYLLVITVCLFFPGSFPPALIIILGAGKLFYFFSSPFKQLATGREKFRLLMQMSIVSNILKATLLLVLALTKSISLYTTITVYVISDLSELLASLYFTRRELEFSFQFKAVFSNYRSILKEAWPQVGNVIFFAAMARIDWILIGIILSSVKLAEYSFAYRFFEISLTPLYIIGPLLLPYFSRKVPEIISEEKPFTLLKMELILACFIALMLSLVWSPLVDALTEGRYGAVNQSAIFFLAASMPFMYVNNFFWSILFSQSRLKTILGIVTITLACNIIADLILIPEYQNAGAAAGFLIATLIQSVLFIRVCWQFAEKVWNMILIVPVLAAASITVSATLFFSPLLTIIITAFLFLILILVTGQLKKNEWQLIKSIIRSRKATYPLPERIL